MARVLLVEDDAGIAGLVELYLGHSGHEVVTVRDGGAALRWFETNAQGVDLLVLDLMLPSLDGRGICRRIRDGAGGRPDVPILMVTALDDVRDKLEGFDLGADDYLTKPFNPEELVARVRAILRRAALPPAHVQVAAELREIQLLGRARLDVDAMRLELDGREIPLRPREFDLLRALAARPGVVCSRESLLERVWDNEPAHDSRTVDVHISRLRDRLHQAGTGIGIETVRGTGYRLSIPDA
ncbi:MAG: response regulator transcription factor [Thermomicrobiales bacterium]